MDIIVLSPNATERDLKHILKKLESRGLQVNISKGTERTIIGVIGDTSKITEEEENAISIMTGVENVMRILKPYKLASRDFKAADTIINVRGQSIGGKKIQVIAGPCAVENRTILMSIGEKVKDAGASFIRGGAFKPRTSPYSFQGLGEEGLKYLAAVRKKLGLPVVTELMDPRDMGVISKYADIIQIGATEYAEFQAAP